ncbi:MAG: nucleotide exchange factor GrpE [Gammaproteobacteria bacterium]|nr:nucleotide exchange factor GrpE [Gammaproteobacteria bacterium]MBU1654066.1 nucleotide exchange factor GrpE [Gammaproteobacteria bacterium]MBU1962307.1 nucleotide exchange factor GrpE [Gammaproteobacteria bacterium]
MDEASKQRLLARFSAYLDAVVETEPSDDAESPDLFTLLAELAALKNEVKIESRQVKEALEQFREVFAVLGRANEQLTQELDRQRGQQRTETRAGERELLLELLELRDRLQSGLTHGIAYRPGFLARRSSVERFVAGMNEGLAMNLRRLDETLSRRGICPIETLGRPFDPHTMRTLEVENHPQRASNEVIAEIRRGYRRDDELLRTAEVIVNKHRRPINPTENPSND